ncbi:DUF262 domain-containing protein [Archaeoglobus sp.]|uniref:DUF262 domain-containing protein n=1 Tax=Archaeoglobus sp. TaxID=1872626 RepID=UPI0024AC5F95|nr:DUF262 domain-containing protein [Archaeoglobus sp.]MDI3497040.1 hypothetical protein [Archaeoglobus sp.]
MLGARPKPNAQAKNVYELFAGKVFKVPDYQRNYAWEKKNWEDFWNDLKEGLLTNTEHYWGTITLKATDKSTYCPEKDIPFNVYEVVDGQQRITTIYLFLLALANVGKPALRDNFIKCGNIYRLELGGLNNQFLKDLVDNKNPDPEIKSNRLLKECLEYFENQIRSFNQLDKLSLYLQNITFTLEFVVQDDTLAVKAFESLNDRGKPLTLLDKTKSYLMFVSLRYLDSRLNDKIKNVFGNVFTNYDIIKELGESENIDYIKSNRFTEDEILRFFYHYFADYSIKQYNLKEKIGYDYDATTNDVFEIFLKKSCENLRNDTSNLKNFVEEFLDEIEKFTLSFKKIIEKVGHDCKFKKLFSFLGLNTRVYPLIISLELKGWLNDTMIDLIETLDLRVYKIRGTDPRASLYRDVISKIKTISNIEEVKSGIVSFIEEFMPDPLFQHYLNQGIYDNPATKYILWEYEKYEDPSFDDCDYELYMDCQKEHIFAKNPKPTFPSYGFSDEEEYFANIDKLGNLCLLEEKMNKQCQNKLINQKTQYYQQSKIRRTKQLGFDIENKGFSKSDINKITKDIIEFSLNRWRV